MKKSSALEKFKDFFVDPNSVSLTQEEQNKFDRLTTSYKIVKNCHIWSSAARKICALYNVSERTAYNYISQSFKLFANNEQYSPDFLRNFIIEDALLQIATSKAGKANHKAWVEARNTLLKLYLSEKGQENFTDPSLLGNNTYLLILPTADGKVIEQDMMDIDRMSKDKQKELIYKLYGKEINEAEATAILTNFTTEDETAEADND